MTQTEIKKPKQVINYSKQDVTSEDIDAVVNVLKSNYLTQGPEVPSFEKEISHKVGCNHAVAVNSGTSALHIACMALNLEKGDILWTSANTFVASANCGAYCGAKIDFLDICPRTKNISIDALKIKLKIAKANDSLPKIIVPVHFAGLPTDQEEIFALSKEYNFKIIEDASHSLGAKYKNEDVGSCKWSDITTFSFHPVKPITSGEGGMAVTNDRVLFEAMKRLRTHGIEYLSEKFIYQSPSPWHYEQQTLGYNYRMTDIQAALGRSQLKRLDTYTSKRNEIANRYGKFLKNLPLNLPQINTDYYSAYHLYVITLKLDELNKTHEQIFNGLKKRGLGINIHYIPVHLHPFYRRMGFKEGDFIEAEKYSKSAISIPLHPQLSLDQQDFVIKSLADELS